MVEAMTPSEEDCTCQRCQAYRRRMESTHSEECWKWHTGCAIQEIAQLRRQVAELELKVSEDCQPTPAEVVRGANEAHARAEQYLEALREFGQHDHNCPAYDAQGPCDCGFKAALSGSSAEAPKEEP